jgi:glycosyltransferase involved in cell wall biosynthesis
MKKQEKLRHKVLFITNVPSPYQRDLFRALFDREDVGLSVYYMDTGSPENPWPEKPLRSFESMMPGFWLPLPGGRMHINWRLPNVADPEIVVLSNYTSVTAQLLMRHMLRRRRWLFWGERLRRHAGPRALIQQQLVGPISRSVGVVGIGRLAEEDYSCRFPKLPHFSIPYHCDLSGFFSISRDSRPPAPLTFLFCGQMIWRKGLDILLIAFDRLINSGFDVRLLLVGREAELQKFFGDISPAARSKICYAGFQAPERLPLFFQQCDVFILPSRYDGWGVVINQAMAAGVPIISSNAVGAGVELVEDGINGLCVNSNDVDSLYRAMETLASAPDLARAWGQSSRERARNLTPEAGARKWVRVFDRVRAGTELPAP